MIAPSTRSVAFDVVNGDGVVTVVADAPLPPSDPSTAAGNTVATPDHSDTFTAADFAADNVTVTLVTDDAPSRYQISTREFVPLRKPTGPFVHAPEPESVTLNTDAELPAAIATDATSAFPDADGAFSVAAKVAVLPLAGFCCTNPIAPPPPDETVTVTVAVGESSRPSFALYVNESGPEYPPVAVYVPPEQLGSVAVPCDAGLTIEHVNGSLFGSDTTGVHGVDTPDAAFSDTGPAVGA